MKHVYHQFRVVLPDGQRIYLVYNDFTGPFFYYDKHHHRPVPNWINNQDIIKMFYWFLKRGCKA